MKTCTIVVCEKCQRMKRLLEWSHFDDLDQTDKDMYARMETEKKLQVLFTICPICTPPSLAAGEIIY
jgi:ssDNA-binding Zn-finger/Zn-ribbon topoisomerase 1